MKTNMKKRKIFEDAVDLMTGSVELGKNKDVCLIDIDKIAPFHDHPFRLYEGERLEDMVRSIKAYGILNPVIVNETDGRYEMLAGHNRMNAAKLAGLKEIPAFVKKGLTEDEEYIYVIETNVMQRSFAELLPSEKAAVISEHYQKICGTMKKDEILRELGRLNQVSASARNGGHDVHQTAEGGENGGHDVHQMPEDREHGDQIDHRVKTRDIVAAEYGFSSRNAARYLRINYLIEPFKEQIDDNRLSLVAGVDVSYLTEDEQRQVWKITDSMGWKISPKIAAGLRKKKGFLSDGVITDIFEKPKKKKAQGLSIRISRSLQNKYFEGMGADEMIEVIDRALEAWFANINAV